MLKKIRSLTYQYALPAAFIVFILLKLLIMGLGRLLSLLPVSLTTAYLTEIILMVVPVAFVFFFGFSSAFKKGNFFRGLLYCLPLIVFQLIILVIFFSNNLGNPDANWRSLDVIICELFAIVGVGVREECIYRATIQNIVAKKHANSVKGVWLTVLISAAIFGLTHVTNILFGANPLAVLSQVIYAFFFGLLFGAIYLRNRNIWVLILVHTLTDTASLAESTFLRYISDTDVINNIAVSWSFPWRNLIIWLFYIGLTIFLLRPSKCKEIQKNLCFAKKDSEA